MHMQLPPLTAALACLCCFLPLFVANNVVQAAAPSAGHPALKADDFLTAASLPAFKQKFLTFASEALQDVRIADMFRRNVHRGSGRRRAGGGGGEGTMGGHGQGQSRSQGRSGVVVGSAAGAKRLLGDLKVKVDRKYSRATGALRRLKSEFERNVMSPSTTPRRRQPCCVKGGGGGGSAGGGPPRPPGGGGGMAARYKYEGRYRDLVDVGQECIGKSEEAANTPFSLRANDAFQLMKTNYENDTSIMWQYMATVSGLFVQFPSKDRYCDESGNIISPLTQRWMVDKLLQKKLNLVILVDASQKMNSLADRHRIPGSPGPPPVRHMDMVKDAAKRLVKELAFYDRVSVVVTDGQEVRVPPGCTDRLLVATDTNSDLIRSFVDSVNPSAFSDPDLAAGFEKAYSLLRAEKAQQVGVETNDVIVLLTNGEYVVLDEKKIMENIKDAQDALDNRVTHQVYTIQSGSVTAALDFLTQLADLNNKVNNASGWPGVSGPVGPPGHLELLPESLKFDFSQRVAQYYRFFPTGTTTVGDPDRITAVAPRRDSKVGLYLTYAIPIYNSTIKSPASLHGVAAVDVSMASLFDDVMHFRWGLDSYSFVVERDRRLVLVHPKLENPAKETSDDPVLCTLEFVEPSLSDRQRDLIVSANASVSSFQAEIVPGRSTYRTGQEILDSQKTPAVVVYSRLAETQYVLVVVVFLSELTAQPSTPVEKDVHLGFVGMALYHHQLTLENQTSHGVCVDSDDHKVKVKFSPEIFTDPEVYIHSKELPEDIANMTEFLNHDAPPPPTIRPEALNRVVGDLRVISSLEMSTMWHDVSAGGIVERFLGTPNGVFSAYPGASLPNSYDGKEYGWYRESLARPGTVWVALQRSFTSRYRRVTLSKTAGDHLNSYAVTGVTVSRRFFAGLFYNTVGLCLGSDYTCHLLTDSGYLLDMLDVNVHLPPASRRHLTKVYPWLATELIRRHVMKPVWCTTLSQARHSLTYILHVPGEKGVTHEGHVQDACRQFLLYPVTGTNLLSLVLSKRGACRESSNPTESCKSCDGAPGGGGALCASCTPSAGGSLSPPSPLAASQCQCPCHCQVDVNVCLDSYQHIANATFPLTACYEEPEMPSLGSPEGPDRPANVVPPCDQLCPTFEKEGDCEAISHCHWRSEQQTYPFCEPIITTTTAISTTTVSTLSSTSASTTSSTTATKKTGAGVTDSQRSQGDDSSSSSGMGGGAIAGTVVGVVLALLVTLLLLAAYFKYLRPRLFSRLTETDSVAGMPESCNEAHYTASSQSMDLNLQPLPPSHGTATDTPF